MFYKCQDSDIEKCADDTTPYACASDIDIVIYELKIAASKLFTWFSNKKMKANPKKPLSFEF